MADPADRIAQIRRTHLHLLSNEDIVFLLSEVDRLSTERGKALKILRTQSGDDLLDACRQVKQVAISEADNSLQGEIKLTALQIEQDALRQQIAERDHQVDQLCGDVRTLNDAEREAAHALAALSQGITHLIERWRAQCADRGFDPQQNDETGAYFYALRRLADELAAVLPSPAAEPTEHE